MFVKYKNLIETNIFFSFNFEKLSFLTYALFNKIADSVISIHHRNNITNCKKNKTDL